MRARATTNKFVGCPAAVSAFGSPQSDTNITLGKEYEVHALSVFQGVVCLQIVNDVNIISWLPSWFFEISEPTMPKDWVCCLPGENLQVVLGPEFVASDESSYNRMVELDSELVTAFWRRVDAKAQAEREH
jgi:hypothetical protein